MASRRIQAKAVRLLRRQFSNAAARKYLGVSFHWTKKNAVYADMDRTVAAMRLRSARRLKP